MDYCNEMAGLERFAANSRRSIRSDGIGKTTRQHNEGGSVEKELLKTV
jgi:hypothetical protein